jgi:hypothetical protein
MAQKIQYPGQGFVNRDPTGEKRGFPKSTSLYPTLFPLRPSPLADNR